MLKYLFTRKDIIEAEKLERELRKKRLENKKEKLIQHYGDLNSFSILLETKNTINQVYENIGIYNANI